ncbi:DUF4097 family beta strand repeat-containing protein [Planomicrobium sp. Y74]|uniref:DUF4097 family beta strand repeat-containing protein n=1 Tax=Planomicrobium sp. Y74 TaxID=2478977 RepID=UPI000EF46283|nr:DUF4097 family beta strand repeat-containing protein [Planomicrobium sp. Y74]RLQ91460.1 DUF1700 domain-containing protein [Planomicrobium sp. Y74]
MTEQQFLQQLEQALERLPAEERNDILQDIREYFANGRADGKSDSDIALELGSPDAIAKELVDSFDFSQSTVPAEKIDISKDKFDKVDIQTDNAVVQIFPSADGQMHVDVENKTYRQHLAVDILDRTLVITLKEEARKWGFFTITGSFKSPTLIVQLPPKLYGKIQILSDHGTITGERLESTELLVETDNGSIELSRINAEKFAVKSDNGAIKLITVQAKNLRAETDNGQLTLKDIQAGKLHAVSDNGGITLKEVEGDVQAQTDNGRIHLLAADLERSISMETDNGSILLETKRHPENATINAEVDWGSVSVFGSKKRRTVYGTGQHPIDLQSDNGSITVKLV